MKKIISIIVSITLVFCMAVTLSSCNESQDASYQYEFDAEKAPPAVKEVIFLKGTPEEMGVQYGEQEKDSFSRWCSFRKAATIDQFGNIAEAYDQIGTYEEIYEEQIPDYLEILKGISKGSGIPYRDVLIAESVFVAPVEHQCSTVSMWGDATRNEDIIIGSNMDVTLQPTAYEPAVVAFPDDGIPFIAAAGFNGNSFMNAEGLSVMVSLGQSAQPEDVAPGVGLTTAGFAAVMNCTTTEEAEKYLTETLNPANYGSNYHVIDASGNASVIEITADRFEIRKSGDFKEKDYMIATNGYMTEKMQKSLYTGDAVWDDWMPRYWTEEKVLMDNFGKNTVDTLNKALKQTGYYVEGEYVKDVWDLEEYKGFWLPENREPGTKCQVRTIAMPKYGSMYIMAGGSEALSNNFPEGTGNFFNIILSENHKEMLYMASKSAQMQIWLGARDISKADVKGGDREENLDIARAALYEGLNYQSLAGCENDSDKALDLYGESISAFCRAQCYAQLAQDNPDKLMREGSDYEF